MWTVLCTSRTLHSIHCKQRITQCILCHCSPHLHERSTLYNTCTGNLYITSPAPLYLVHTASRTLSTCPGLLEYCSIAHLPPAAESHKALPSQSQQGYFLADCISCIYRQSTDFVIKCKLKLKRRLEISGKRVGILG